MAARGIDVSHETVRDSLARPTPTSSGGPGPVTSGLDELVVTIKGRRRYLWRAVDQRGITWGCWSPRRDTHAARRFLRKLLAADQYVPRVLVTDKLRSYGAAKRQVLPSVEHRRSRYLNNRAENSHQRTRLRERAMRRFASPGRPAGSATPTTRSTGTSGRRSIS